MLKSIHFEPLVPSLYNTYIEIGTRAYDQHYRHLWPNGETATYIQSSFKKEILLREEKDENTNLYLIQSNGNYAGILKITLHKAVANYSKLDALYLDKIYIQKEYTGLGIGKETLKFVMERAKNLTKKAVFLEAMQKGPALNFYIQNKFTIITTTHIPFTNALEEEKPMYVLLKEI